MLCVHPDLICLLIVISQGDRNWQGGTTFGSQNQSGGTDFGGGTKIFVTVHLFPFLTVELLKTEKRVYRSAVEDRRGNFTPFVLSVDGLLQREASHFVKRVSANLASRWEKPLSDVLTYIRSRLYCLLRCALPACV